MVTNEQANKEEEADLIAAACIFVLFVRGGAEWQGVIRNGTYEMRCRKILELSCR